MSTTGVKSGDGEALGRQRRLIERLREPSRYPHPVTRISLLETHISFVLLTGTYAYKIKKAVDLGFVDYTTLERRRFFCNEEMRLNRRLAPRLYRDVVGIGGTADEPQLGDGAPAIEFAVRMLEFDQAGLLDHALARGTLTPSQIDALAATIAAFHLGAPVATTAHVSPKTIREAAEANFVSLGKGAGGQIDQRAVQTLAGWTRAECDGLAAAFGQRLAAGFVRECHGDLHLGNIALFEDELQIFDGIEFNAALRWVDIVSDIAFLVMDLSQRGRLDYSWRLLNAWLERTGDYAGLDLLRFYEVYRALVRAKVAHLRAIEASASGTAKAPAPVPTVGAYIDHALKLIAPRPRALIVMHGLSGSGKSVVARELAQTLAAVCLRSDVERKRLQGMPALARSDDEMRQTLYDEAATRATYARLADLAAASLVAGYPVIVDATYLRRWQRDRFRAVAQLAGVPFLIIDCRAPVAVLRQRITARAQSGGDASEATGAVLARQRLDADPLDADEQTAALVVDTSSAAGTDAVRSLVRRHLGKDWNNAGA